MKYLKISNRVANLSNKVAYMYFVLVWMKSRNKYITRSYLAKCLGIKDLGTISEYLQVLVREKLISLSYLEVFGKDYKTRLIVNILPCKGYFLVKDSFIYKKINSASKGFILRLRCFCWDDSLKIYCGFTKLSSLLGMCEKTLKKYLMNNFQLPCMGMFFRQLNQLQRKFNSAKNQIVRKISNFLDIPEYSRKAKWCLQKFNGFNIGIYNWLISGVKKHSTPVEQPKINYVF